MNRERALKVVLMVVGGLLTATVVPLFLFARQGPALAMMLSIYVTLGIFLLMASRNPSENRSLIAFTAWSSFAHGALMAVQVWQKMIPRFELMGVGVMAVIWVALIALRPATQAKDRATAAGA